MQDSYIINQPAYLQLKVSQQGYDGEFQLSAVLNEGACELSMQGSDLPTDGTWTSMSNTTEILTLTPTLAGPLRISFEVKTKRASSPAAVSSTSMSRRVPPSRWRSSTPKRRPSPSGSN
ncbi:MAG: hypothetical protein ACLRMJ_02070 [Alistipes finegoldii]